MQIPFFDHFLDTLRALVTCFKNVTTEICLRRLIRVIQRQENVIFDPQKLQRFLLVISFATPILIN